MNANPVIPHNKPSFDKKDYKALALPLETSWVARGKFCIELENNFDIFLTDKKTENPHSLCVSSGTAALYLALVTLNTEQNTQNRREIIFPTYTCSAVMNAVKIAGLKPVLCDINPNTLNPDPKHYSELITPDTAGIIITHSHGLPADTMAIKKTVHQKGSKKIFIIEDCCQSLGSKSTSKSCGASGDAAIFSFHATKIITGGQGGLVYFEKPSNRQKALNFIDYDMPDNSNLRFNFLLSDINASLALNQFKKLHYLIAKRKKISRAYEKVLIDIFKKNSSVFHPNGLFPRLLPINKNSTETNHNHYRFIICLNPKYIELFIKNMHNKGISVINPFEESELLHLIYKTSQNSFQGAKEAISKTISIPVFPSLKTEQIQYIIKSMKSTLKELKKDFKHEHQ